MQMDIKRTILLVIFVFSLVTLWGKWNEYNAPKGAPAAAQSGAVGSQGGAVPTPASSGALAPVANVPVASASTVPSYTSAANAVVTTDLMKVTVSAKGGDIIRVELLKHKDSADHSKNFMLLQDEGAHFYVARSGLIGSDLPYHDTLFTIKPVTTTADGKQQLSMVATAPNGVTVTKVLTFDKDYQIDVRYDVANAGSAALNTSAYFELVRDDKPTEQKKGLFGGASAYTGPAIYTSEGKFQKVDFEKIAKGEAKHVGLAKDGWVAMLQHYFVTAYLPKAGTEHEFFTRKISDTLFGAGVKFPVAVPAGKTVSFDVPLYVGPQEQNKLNAVAPGFDLVVDYGWTTIIANPLFKVLSWVHSLIGNWGWSILLVTALIKLVFFPLSASSYKSMAKMKQVMPRMKALQERYGSDKVKYNQAMMELYKTEKVNPMGGCLPIVVQMPVFMALYYVLQSVVEMRQAPWLGWIQDLSSPDPYFILPLIMGATMLVQTKLNPTPADPVQAKVMMFMPVMFTVMFLWFPSGLVLYWVLNNILSIAQQWYITRMINNGAEKPAQ